MRIVFAGTPEFAAHHLVQLCNAKQNLVAVYSQPDRPAGRGKKLTPSPVKKEAQARGITVYQPLRFDEEAQSKLQQLKPDLMIVVAYGLILPQAVLDIPRLGCINVHASLLPRWRGAAPIQRAIEAGDSDTGISIMQMEAGLDTGPVITYRSCNIEPADTAASLHDKLAALGAILLLEALDDLLLHKAIAVPQDSSLACYAEKITKDQALIDWCHSPKHIDRQIRAFFPAPTAFTFLGELRIKVQQAECESGSKSLEHLPGTIIDTGPQGISVACKGGSISLKQLQLPGKTSAPAQDLLRGHPHLFKVGQRFSIPNKR